MSNNLDSLYDTAIRYGVDFTGTLVDGTYHDQVDHTDQYTLWDVQQAGGKISRLRLLSDRGCPFWDISYCHATLPDGRIVPVQVTSGTIWKKSIKGSLIKWAKLEGVFAKGIGLLDESNWSTQQ